MNVSWKKSKSRPDSIERCSVRSPWRRRRHFSKIWTNNYVEAKLNFDGGKDSILCRSQPFRLRYVMLRYIVVKYMATTGGGAAGPVVRLAVTSPMTQYVVTNKTIQRIIASKVFFLCIQRFEICFACFFFHFWLNFTLLWFFDFNLTFTDIMWIIEELQTLFIFLCLCRLQITDYRL